LRRAPIIEQALLLDAFGTVATPGFDRAGTAISTSGVASGGCLVVLGDHGLDWQVSRAYVGS
jgi:hypothetical protein